MPMPGCNSKSMHHFNLGRAYIKDGIHNARETGKINMNECQEEVLKKSIG